MPRMRESAWSAPRIRFVGVQAGALCNVVQTRVLPTHKRRRSCKRLATGPLARAQSRPEVFSTQTNSAVN
jgi:hypothetical protein